MQQRQEGLDLGFTLGGTGMLGVLVLSQERLRQERRGTYNPFGYLGSSTVIRWLMELICFPRHGQLKELAPRHDDREMGERREEWGGV
jgi:hypothetical protein